MPDADGDRRTDRGYTICPFHHSSNKRGIKIWSEFCDIYVHAQPIFLLCYKFQTIILKTIEIAETQS